MWVRLILDSKGECRFCEKNLATRCICHMSYSDGIDWVCDSCADEALANEGFEEWRDYSDACQKGEIQVWTLKEERRRAEEIMKRFHTEYEKQTNG